MPSHLAWPFFEDRHRAWTERVRAWARDNLQHVDHADTDASCRNLVSRMGAAGLLKVTAPGEGNEKLDVRTLVLAREALASHDGLADFAFAMQGLGAGPISLFGNGAQRAEWLPKTRSGEAIAAFARGLAEGPTFAHMMTKTMLAQEWSMSVDQAIEAEAQAQAICMQTQDFRRAYEGFIAKEKPRFAGD